MTYIFKDNYIEKLKELGYQYIDGEYESDMSKLRCYDKEGYIVYCILQKMNYYNHIPRRFDHKNDYTIYNIKRYFELNPENGCQYVSGEYKTNKSKLLFELLLFLDDINTKIIIPTTITNINQGT